MNTGAIPAPELSRNGGAKPAVYVASPKQPTYVREEDVVRIDPRHQQPKCT